MILATASSVLLGVVAVAVLFAAHGLLRRGRERSSGCDACHTPCPAKPRPGAGS